jgi:hypothetical protein
MSWSLSRGNILVKYLITPPPPPTHRMMHNLKRPHSPPPSSHPGAGGSGGKNDSTTLRNRTTFHKFELFSSDQRKVGEVFQILSHFCQISGELCQSKHTVGWLEKFWPTQN